MRKVCAGLGVLMSVLGMALWSPGTGRAAGSDIQLSGNLGREEFRSLTRQLGFAASYFPLAPAAPLGILGFDAGVEATAVNISQPSSFWRKAVRDQTPPSYLVIPRVHVQKGLPFDIDVGASFTSVPFTNMSIIGGEVKWAVSAGGMLLPAVAVRVSGTKLFGGSEVGLETYGADLSISKGVLFFTPYAGIGQLYVNSRTNSTAIRAVSGADFRETESLTKLFVGLKIKPPLLPFSMVAEADFGTVAAYSLRANISF